MPSNTGAGKSGHHPNIPTLKENVGGSPGKESHGGDVAPPNSDDAGRRQSPESGPPDQH